MSITKHSHQGEKGLGQVNISDDCDEEEYYFSILKSKIKAAEDVVVTDVTLDNTTVTFKVWFPRIAILVLILTFLGRTIRNPDIKHSKQNLPFIWTDTSVCSELWSMNWWKCRRTTPVLQWMHCNTIIHCIYHYHTNVSTTSFDSMIYSYIIKTNKEG